MTNRTVTCKLAYKSPDGSITFELANFIFVEGSDYEVIAFSTNTFEEAAIRSLDGLTKEILLDVYKFVTHGLSRAIKNEGSAFEYFRDIHSGFSTIKVDDVKTFNRDEDLDMENIIKYCSLTEGGQFNILFPRLNSEIIDAFEEM